MAWADLALKVAAEPNGDAVLVWEDGEPRAVFDRLHVMRATLLVNTLKWRAAKQLPHVFSDRLTVEGDPNNPLQVSHTVQLDEIAGQLTREERATIRQLMDRRESRARSRSRAGRSRWRLIGRTCERR